MSFAEGVGDGKEIPAVESCCIGSGGAWSFVVGYEGNFILSVSVGAVPSVDVWTAAWHVHNFVYIYRGRSPLSECRKLSSISPTIIAVPCSNLCLCLSYSSPPLQPRDFLNSLSMREW